jgi:hypothetical protein
MGHKAEPVDDGETWTGREGQTHRACKTCWDTLEEEHLGQGDWKHVRPDIFNDRRRTEPGLTSL